MIGSTIRQMTLEVILEGLWLDFLESPCQVSLIKDFPGIETTTIKLSSRAKHSTLTIPLYQALVLWMLGYASAPEADFLPNLSTIEGFYRKEKRSRVLQSVNDHALLGSRILIQMQEKKTSEKTDNYYDQKMYERLRESYNQFLNRRIRKIMDINYLNDNNIKQVNVTTEERILVQLISEIYRAWHQHFLKWATIDEIMSEKD